MNAMMTAKVKRRNLWYRERLTAAFRELRKQGYVARQRFKCCMGCALEAFDGMNLADKHGVVYYHAQDADAFKRVPATSLYVRFSGNRANTSRVVGQVVVRALEKAGLPTHWNGQPCTAIEVPIMGADDFATYKAEL